MYDEGNKTNIKLYNILLPIWMLVFVPSLLWLILIPANYIIDRIVLKWSLGDLKDKGLFCRKHTWKICIAGFLGDLAGALLMLIIFFPLAEITGDGTSFLEKASDGIMFDPFSNILSLLIVVAAIVLAAVCIYYSDKFILRMVGLDAERAKRSAIRMALITAPYLYLIPSRLLYDSGGSLIL